MTGMGLFGLVLIVISLYAIVQAVVLIARAMFPREIRLDFPRCGRCGYDVTGLAGHRCPECGAGLLDVGIIGRRDHRSGQRGASLLQGLGGWTALLVVTAFLITAIGMNRRSPSTMPWLILIVVTWAVGVFAIAQTRAAVMRRRQQAAEARRRQPGASA